MPLPTSQPNWSPKMGLNLASSLPPSNGALPLLGTPDLTQVGVPQPALLAEESRALASVVAFGSIPIQSQLFRPFSPHLGRPNNLPSQPPAPVNGGHGTDLHKAQRLYGGTVRPDRNFQVGSQSSIRTSHDMKSLIASNRSVVMAGNVSETNNGSVWVPDKRAGPSGNGPVLTYKHDTSHPPWSSGADYDDIVDWRIPRVISNDAIAVKFNLLCITARALNGLDHRSDPLPWCRDGSDPVNEAAVSAEYNLYALQANDGRSSQGEDECLRLLLAGPDEPKVTPGRSVERLLSAHSHVIGHMSSSSEDANKRIRKESPVMRRADLLDVPLTRTRLNENPFFPLGNNDELDELDEIDKVETTSSSSLTPNPTSVPATKSVAKTGTSRATRGKKSPRFKKLPLPTLDSAVKQKTTVLVQPQQGLPNNNDHPASLSDGQVTPVNSPPKKTKGKKKTSSPTTFRWSHEPDEKDYMWLSHLVEFKPFSVAKCQAEQFHQCTLHLKEHPQTWEMFRFISDKRQTRTLRNRYEALKLWLPRAERVSARASGTQEVDEKLRELLKTFIDQEKELEVAALATKAEKEAALNTVGRADDLRQDFAGRHRSGPTPAGMTEEEAQLDEGSDHRPANSIRGLRTELNKKFGNEGTGANMVSVTLKSSEAQERANEITLMALEQHQQQTNLTNLQRERELAQSQSRLDLDSHMAKETLNLRREELTAATSRKEKTEEHIDELKSSMSNVQGTLAEMGSVLKLLAERIPDTNPS